VILGTKPLATNLSFIVSQALRFLPQDSSILAFFNLHFSTFAPLHLHRIKAVLDASQLSGAGRR
jgi:hypothetical protein